MINNREIHVDDNKCGAGIQLISSVPAGNVGVRGPSMEYIGTCVKNYMQKKFGA